MKGRKFVSLKCTQQCTVQWGRELIWNGLIQISKKLHITLAFWGGHQCYFIWRIEMDDSSSMIIARGVDNVQIEGWLFTWYNGRMWEKIDRVLVNVERIISFQILKYPISIEVHCPPLMTWDGTLEMSKFSFGWLYSHHEYYSLHYSFKYFSYVLMWSHK